MPAHGGREPTDAALHEEVRGVVSARLREHLLHHHAVALHDDGGDTGVLVVRGVRDQEPSVRAGVRGALADRVVVVAGDPMNDRPVSGDRPLARLADVGVEVDAATASEHLRSPGHRAAVVAVRGARDGEAGDARPVTAGQQVAGGGVPVACGDEVLLKQTEHRVGAAEGLEAVQPETLVLVLVRYGGEVQSTRKPRQGHQRSRPVARPGRNLGACRVDAGAIDDPGLARAVGSVTHRSWDSARGGRGSGQVP